MTRSHVGLPSFLFLAPSSSCRASSLPEGQRLSRKEQVKVHCHFRLAAVWGPPGAAAGAWAAPRPPNLSPQRLGRRLCGPGVTPGSAGGWPLAGPGPGYRRAVRPWRCSPGYGHSEEEGQRAVHSPAPVFSLEILKSPALLNLSATGGCPAPSWQPSPYSTGPRRGLALPSSSVLPLSPTPTVSPSSQG